MIFDPVAVLGLVGRPLVDANLRWVVGGSVASSFHGVPRSTLDVDLVVELPSADVDRLAKAWSRDFLVDAAMIRDALARGGCCNLIHLDSALKVDLFLGVDDPWVRQELSNPEPLDLLDRALASGGMPAP